MTLLRNIGLWFYDRLALQSVLGFLREHKVPPELATRKGWLYTTGLATFMVFLLQLVTGMALTSQYIPSPAHAHGSLVVMTEDPLGAFLRALHFFGASAMVVLVLLHMARVFLTGSYKYPREMQWISGVFLLVLVFSMAWTGQLLRWNEDGLWTVMVGARFAERVPFVGEWFAQVILGGETVGGKTLSRFFALHVIVFPLAILGLVGLHMFLLLQNGVSELPKVGRRVDPRTYRQWYKRMKETTGKPYFPDVMWRELVVAAVVFAIIVVLALVMGPRPPGLPPDPTQLAADPRPDWFVIWYYALLWVKPRGAEDLFMVWLPIGLIAGLVALPLIRGRTGERAPSRRPWAVGAVGLIVVLLSYLIVLGVRAPWVPDYATEPFTAAELPTDHPDVVAGAAVFHARGCQYCHQVMGRGGLYGPDLTDVTRRMSPEEVNVRIVRGIRDMPAYGEMITREELDLLLAFLQAAEGR